MTDIQKEKFSKFVSQKLKMAKPFTVNRPRFGEVEVYVSKVTFNFYYYSTKRTSIQANIELKFRQITEPSRTNFYGWTKHDAGRKRNEFIRHEILCEKKNDISHLCKIFGINYTDIVKITQSKARKNKVD